MNTPTPSKPGRILVVDDNEMNRDMLSRRLQRRGHYVETAENGQQALDCVAAGETDLVLLDVMMPVLNGYETLERLQADPDLCHIPVVMISAVDEMESIVRCIQAGAADYLPKPFNATILHARVESCLARKRLHDQAQQHVESLEREMAIGRKIQAGFLPAELPTAPGWDLAASFCPARECAGDFYDAFWIPGASASDGRIALVVADVCDKGVGAALFMALIRSLLRASAQWHAEADGALADPSAHLLKLVHTTNDYVARTHEADSMFATVFVGALDPRTGALVYVNGGHEAPVLVRAGGARERLGPSGPAVGMMPEMSFETRSVTLAPGDALVAFTDGVTDAQDTEGAFFTEERLFSLLDPSASSASSQLEAILDALGTHTQNTDPFDDITILAVRREALRREG
jgi:serine phosphatase RsbU (regulator of sigma subunit)